MEESGRESAHSLPPPMPWLKGRERGVGIVETYCTTIPTYFEK